MPNICNNQAPTNHDVAIRKTTTLVRSPSLRALVSLSRNLACAGSTTIWLHQNDDVTTTAAVPYELLFWSSFRVGVHYCTTADYLRLSVLPAYGWAWNVCFCFYIVEDEVNDRDDSSVPSSKSGSPQGKKGWIRKLLGRMRRKE